MKVAEKPTKGLCLFGPYMLFIYATIHGLVIELRLQICIFIYQFLKNFMVVCVSVKQNKSVCFIMSIEVSIAFYCINCSDAKLKSVVQKRCGFEVCNCTCDVADVNDNDKRISGNSKQ